MAASRRIGSPRRDEAREALEAMLEELDPATEALARTCLDWVTTSRAQA